jgi:hypothetical protein
MAQGKKKTSKYTSCGSTNCHKAVKQSSSWQRNINDLLHLEVASKDQMQAAQHRHKTFTNAPLNPFASQQHCG